MGKLWWNNELIICKNIYFVLLFSYIIRIKYMKSIYYIPPTRELKNLSKWSIDIWTRESIQTWTNCSWEFFNYINKKWENIRLFIKHSFLKTFEIKQFEQDYLLLKDTFKNIIPNTAFISSFWEIFTFSSPISIKIDILKEDNQAYFISILKDNKSLQKQLGFFIDKYEYLMKQWKILDLFWKENLVISEDNKLYYIDSFFVFSDNFKYIKDSSLENLEKLKQILIDVKKS